MTSAAARPHLRETTRAWPAWPVALGLLCLAAPTAWRLAGRVWLTDGGSQGPLVLATGAWLLARQAATVRAAAAPGGLLPTVVILAASLTAYLGGRMFDYLTIEALGLYGAGVAIFYSKFGAGGLRAAWFPIAYLAFAIPPPGIAVEHLTAPLKQFAAWVSTESLRAFGLPISRDGVTLTVAQYQLLVEDACSGMNSLFGLTAVSLLYIYLLRVASPYYALLLGLFVAPIAVAANIVRIICILLVTYFLGDGAGQSFIHLAAGLLLFAAALALVFGLDAVLHPLWLRLARRR
jgi:exosortase